tara:strand:+ start:501 stop:950 length:450 start_codon:yes stop_codon:yes gene_type:complete
MLKSGLICGIALAAAIITFNASAEAYKWTSPAGDTIYSQTPPPIGTPYELVDDRSIASTNFSSSNTSSIQKNLDSSRESREQKKAEQQQIAESNQIKKENCAQAKTNLTSLTSRGQVTIKEGELYRKLTEEERQDRIKTAHQSIEEFCN